MTKNFFVKPGHSEYAADLPWKVAEFSSRLIKYIAGGGMMAFGRTIEQDRRDYKQNRFLAAMGVDGTIYLILWII